MDYIDDYSQKALEQIIDLPRDIIGIIYCYALVEDKSIERSILFDKEQAEYYQQILFDKEQQAEYYQQVFEECEEFEQYYKHLKEQEEYYKHLKEQEEYYQEKSIERAILFDKEQAEYYQQILFDQEQQAEYYQHLFEEFEQYYQHSLADKEQEEYYQEYPPSSTNTDYSDDDVEMQQDEIETKSTSDIEDKPYRNEANKPLKRPKKTPSPHKHKKEPIQNTFAQLSCDISSNTHSNSNNTNEHPNTDSNDIPKATSSPKQSKKKQEKTIGRKRKLDEISDKADDTNETPAKKAKKYYPGFKRSDLPPEHGQVEIPQGKPMCLAGIRFVITGQLPSLTREECSDLVQQYGGRVTGGVSGMTRYLIAGEEAGQSKTKKAKEKKVPIIDETAFLDLLRTLPGGKTPKLPKKPSRSKGANALKQLAANRGNGQPGGVVASKRSVSNLLFVDKYKPLTSRDLIGNNKCIQDLKKFLLSWDSIKKDKKYKKKGVLLSGQPGIGKTSAINVIAKELGFNTLEFNASDTRSKKQLRNVVQESLNNVRVTDYFMVKNKSTSTKRKKAKNLIIMDEVDGMSSGDRGGMTELIGYISKSLTPIICICNDRHSSKVRSLANHCLDLRFRKPTAIQIKNRLYNIARNEGFECDMPTIHKLAEGTNGDIRQMLHLLQFWSNDGTRGHSLSFHDVKTKLKGMNQKDLTLGPWDVVPKLFYPQTTVPQGIGYYFVDYGIIPLFVYENYLNLNGIDRCNVKEMECICDASQSIADGDIIDNNIRKSQQYYALPYHGVLSSLKPGRRVGSIARISGRIAFPQWLGKNSAKRKNERLCSELALNMNTNIDCISLDYLEILKKECVDPLKNGTQDDIDDVIGFMQNYGITRNDWDTICSLGCFDIDGTKKKNALGIETRVKSKFTRACNAQLGANVQKINKKKMSVNDLKVKNEDNVQSEDDEYVEDDEENEDDDISKDNSIKMSKGKKGKGTKNKKKKKKKRNTKKKPTKRRNKKTLNDE